MRAAAPNVAATGTSARSTMRSVGPAGKAGPLAEIMLNINGSTIQEQWFPVVEALHGTVEQLVEERKATLQMVQKVLSGELDPSQVTCTDDSWQLKPERPVAMTAIVTPTPSQELIDDAAPITKMVEQISQFKGSRGGGGQHPDNGRTDGNADAATIVATTS